MQKLKNKTCKPEQQWHTVRRLKYLPKGSKRNGINLAWSRARCWLARMQGNEIAGGVLSYTRSVERKSCHGEWWLRRRKGARKGGH